ncbi:MAG: SHOCT domain-containing protein [Alphaproteobacteria bacterium]|nr:SHOCT domain-containing protein [Alphaproteobacteria bacterium]
MSPGLIAIVVLVILAGIGLYMLYRPRSGSASAGVLVDRSDDEDVTSVDSRIQELDAQKARGEITEDEHRARVAELVGDKRKFRWRRRDR